ncbi:hypothetical protein DICPUDRAFT_80399 [Dictyostelium purpureum]|uniref:B box-type domain-containing protein n=1 Tax=Dictyostelium purpureum TaxID=5786 RepID=F0ZQD9_DICPU|nr:uncharacterized protein DICPUDRAFT_80399 [Dictyostelium purpureum]EGC33834.1 hypothetical protein DICPUDRAFT_80399 [Dictyostelium purpureum]|eukprot:XP_003289624.1 hypothetical protein DICPUDRAFT_80399 [Dictyostelium purpureum]
MDYCDIDNKENNCYNGNYNIHCLIHKKDLIFVCENKECETQLACIKCVTTTHKGHLLTDLDEININNKEKIQNLIKEFKLQFPKISNQISINKTNLKKIEDIYSKKSKITKLDTDGVANMFSEVKELVLKTEENYIRGIEDNQMDSESNYSKMKDELEMGTVVLEKIYEKYKTNQNINDSISNNDNSNSPFDNIDFNNKSHIIEILYSNSISKSKTNQNNSFSYVPYNNNTIISSCTDITSAIKTILRSKPRPVPNVNKLPEFFIVNKNKKVPYFHQGYKNFVGGNFMAINFSFCINLSFNISSTITELYLVEGRCDQFLNALSNFNMNSAHLHFYDVDICSNINVYIKYFHFHKYILNELFKNPNNLCSPTIHIYELEKPLTSDSIKGKGTTLHIHEEYDHPIAPGVLTNNGIQYLYLYDIKNGLPRGSLPAALNQLYLDGYKHSFKEIVPENLTVYNKINGAWQLITNDKYW